MKQIGIVLLAALLAACSLTGCRAAVSSQSAAVVNPVTERKSAEEIGKAVKFEMAQLPEVTGFEPVRYATISGKIGQIDYEKPGGARLSLRMAAGKDDISGVGGVEYEQKVMSETQVNLGSYGDMEIAWFTLGDYTYALTSENYDGASLEALTGQFISSLKGKE